jgi:hypothetical protein
VDAARRSLGGGPADIWGRIYLDQWRGEPHPHVYHRDDGNRGVFDAIVCMGNTFGIGATPAGLPGRLDRMRRLLAPHGRLILAMLDALHTTDPAHLAYHARNRAAGRPPGLTRARLEYRGEMGDWWNLWMPTEAELRVAARSAGWAVRQVIPEGSSRVYELQPTAAADATA